MRTTMKHYIHAVKTYFSTRTNKELYIGIGIIGGVVLGIVVVSVLVFNSIPRIVYKPSNACDFLTMQEAQSLLGDRTMKSNVGPPVQSNNVSLSRCGYTNGSGDENTLIVAAIIVRSGVNDKGVEQNKSEFIAGRPTKGVETVTNLGNSAYFNQQNGQLNILNGRDWIIVSYGTGSNPQDNSVEDAVALARKIVENRV